VPWIAHVTTYVDRAEICEHNFSELNGLFVAFVCLFVQDSTKTEDSERIGGRYASMCY